MKKVISSIVDDGAFLEVQSEWAKNIVIGYSHLNGNLIGVIANQPLHLAGCLDIDASNKAARFVRFCDAFNIPLLTLEDVPGFYQEHLKNGVELSDMVQNYYSLFQKLQFQNLQ